MQSEDREFTYSAIQNDAHSQTIIRSNRLKAIFAIIQLTLGVGTTLPHLAIYIYYKDTFHLDVSSFTFFKALPSIAFCLKPIFGFILDTLRFGNSSSTRKYCLTFSALLAGFTWIFLAILIQSQILAVSLRFICTLCVSMIGVILELLVVLSSQGEETESWENKKASQSFSLLNCLILATTALCAYLGGKLAGVVQPTEVFLITAACYLPLFLTVLCCYAEQSQGPQRSNTSINLQEGQLKRCKNKLKRIFCDFFPDPNFLIPFIYVFTSRISPGTSDVMYYYATDELHIDTTKLGLIGTFQAVASVAGTLFYLVAFANRFSSFAFLMFCLTLFKCLAYSLKLLLLLELDFNYTILYGLVQCLGSFAGQIHLLPLMIWAVNFCPRSVEGTFYTVMIFAINLADQISFLVEGVLEKYIISDYSNVWILLLISAMSVLIQVPFLIFGNLDARQKKTRDKIKSLAHRQ